MFNNSSLIQLLLSVEKKINIIFLQGFKFLSFKRLHIVILPARARFASPFYNLSLTLHSALELSTEQTMPLGFEQTINSSPVKSEGNDLRMSEGKTEHKSQKETKLNQTSENYFRL